MAPRTIPRAAALLAAASLLGGCGRDREPSNPPPPHTATPPTGVSAVKHYKLVGVVRKVESGKSLVSITHEEIPGFMPKMTMAFPVKDRALLDDVRDGDEVEGKLRVVSEGDQVKDYDLEDLVVTRPAPPTPLTLSLGPGGPTLSEAPKRLGPGDEVPDFGVTTQDGKPMRLSDLRGKVVALTFVYTRCPLPDFCPKIDGRFAEMAALIPNAPGRADAVRLLSVSFDPEHDTPEVLRKHAAMRGAKPPLWTFAVASHGELAKVGRPLGLYYGPGEKEITHNLTTAVIGPDGRLVRLESGSGWSVPDLLRTMYSRISRPKG